MHRATIKIITNTLLWTFPVTNTLLWTFPVNRTKIYKIWAKFHLVRTSPARRSRSTHHLAWYFPPICIKSQNIFLEPRIVPSNHFFSTPSCCFPNGCFSGGTVVIFRRTPNLEGQSALFISPGAEWPTQTPRHGGAISDASLDTRGLR
jgi:hypothetical protein